MILGTLNLFRSALGPTGGLKPDHVPVVAGFARPTPAVKWSVIKFGVSVCTS